MGIPTRFSIIYIVYIVKSFFIPLILLIYGFLAYWLAESSTFKISSSWKKFFSVSYKACFFILFVLYFLFIILKSSSPSSLE